MEVTAEQDSSGPERLAQASQSTTAEGSLVDLPDSPGLPVGTASSLTWNGSPIRRRRTRRRLAWAVPVMVVVVLLGGWLVLSRVAAPVAGPKVSGFTEADEVFLSAQPAALIREVSVEVGTRVSTGTVVARLDDAAIQLQLRLADPVARQSLQLEADKYVIRSPLAGVVTRVPGHVGEQALPGRVLVAVANTTQLNVSLSVSLRDLAAVRVGQPVAVTVDAMPDRTFSGTVTSINHNAEFTPRNVQTESDRLNLVYGVTARVDNRDGLMKPGMPAEATILVQP